MTKPLSPIAPLTAYCVIIHLLLAFVLPCPSPPTQSLVMGSLVRGVHGTQSLPFSLLECAGFRLLLKVSRRSAE